MPGEFEQSDRDAIGVRGLLDQRQTALDLHNGDFSGPLPARQQSLQKLGVVAGVLGHSETEQRLGLVFGQGFRIEQRTGDDMSFHQKVGLLAVTLLDRGGKVVEKIGRIGETDPTV